MLTISKPLSTGQAHSYHEQEFANSEQNYYSESRRVAGEWHGRLAAEWGLTGTVSSEQFYRLAEGQHPVTGQQLVQHRAASEYQDQHGRTITSAEHRAGWDATFSAPKSVSITALVGADEKVREAHRESVQVALNELERYIQARIGGNHPAETTGAMVAAKFEHESARPVNGYSAPQLHTHVVIFNVTETANRESHALQPHELYRSQSYATAIYRAELASRLKQLGYEIEKGRKGEFEIKGYTPEYLQASSPRRQQIKAYLAANKIAGAESAEIGAHRTRERKTHLTPEEMQRVNLSLAEQHGNDPKGIVRAAQTRRQQSQDFDARRETLARAREAVTFARDRNIEREATVEERPLLADALRRAMGEANLRDIRRNFERRVAQGEFVRVGDGSENSLRHSFTTARMLSYERDNVAMMQKGQNLGTPVVQATTVHRIAAEISNLGESQRKAVREVLESHDQITGLQGAAGSGKTTALRAIRQAAEREGYQVSGFAPTSRAAHRLKEAGIEASTLQKFLLQRSPGDSEQRQLFVLDESSLASTRQFHDFLKRLTSQDRVLLVGDIRQHQAVDAGRPFQQMQEAGMRTARLDQIVRQRDAGLKHAVESMVEGKTADAVNQLVEQRRVHTISNSEERLKAVAREYLKHPETSLVVSPDNPSRLEINRHVHQSLQNQGKVAGKDHRVKILVNRHELTGADRQWAERYEPGDVIRYTQGSRRIGVRPGEYATVVRRDTGEDRNLLTVRRADGKEITYDPKRLRGVNVYQQEERQFAKGDRIQFTAPFKAAEIANRELARVERIDPKGNLRLRLESGRAAQFNLRDHPHLDYGYAMTSYSSQGQTVDRVIIHVPEEGMNNRDLINQRFAYVALSRARMDAQVYTHDASTLADRLSRDISKSAALESESFRQSGHFAFKQGQQRVQEQAQV